jgi:hypothetical protein
MTEVIIYKLHKNFNIKLSDSDKHKVTGTIDEIASKLKENKGYCLKLYEDKPCIVYVDLDHCPDETVFSKFCDLLCVKFDVSLNEISYTLSKKKNEFSYHISIPSIESTPKYLKQVFAMACFDEYLNNKTLDLNVYSNNRWFRLPFQTNDEKPLAHIIIKGKMEDFIVNYVEDADVVLAEDEDSVVVSSVITEKESKVELNDGLDIQDFISELLDILDSDRADDWEKWRNIGFIVHSELGNSGFDMFDTFSQQSNKYNKSKVKKFWESIKDNTYKPMTVKSLMACAKKDNIKEYNEIKKEYVKISSKINNTTVTGVYNDLEAAQVVYSLYKHFVCCDSVLYCFDDSTGLWTDKEEILFSIVSRFNDNV